MQRIKHQQHTVIMRTLSDISTINFCLNLHGTATYNHTTYNLVAMLNAPHGQCHDTYPQATVISRSAK